MPFKIFATPGDHRDDFRMLEDQINEWLATSGANVIRFTTDIIQMPERRQSGTFMLTATIHYEDGKEQV